MCFAETRARGTLLALSVAVFLTSGISDRPLHAQGAATRKTVWDGVYTEAQASRGEARYRTNCSGCHDEGPRRGEAFMRDWSGTDVESLFHRIKTSMPPDAPSSLSDAEYLDIVAYLLRANGFPAGRQELTGDALTAVRIEGPNGPEEVPNYSLVRVVGCLAPASGSEWPLAGVGVPARTKNPAASTGEELAAAAATALGRHTFRLFNVYPRPDAYTGHKVEAKGFLIRDPAGDRINVTAVQSLAPRCDR
jgi:hypothetical protein